MRILWLTNMIPGAVQQQLGRNAFGGLWVDQVLSGLTTRENTVLRVLCLGTRETAGTVDSRLSYRVFSEKSPYVYEPSLEALFCQEISTFQPDVIHIWGTEYGHTLAMAKAAVRTGKINNTVVSIQGLCSVIARHYTEGLPLGVRYGVTLRDALRMDNAAMQCRKFEKRGMLEIEALKLSRHVMGRTPWDRACTARIQPEGQYHFCNETLREAFYQGRWAYGDCTKHRIFASSCAYPVKGFHYLLEAFGDVLKVYPDATISVPGRSFLQTNLRTSRYEAYLAELTHRIHAEDKILFRGDLDAEQMKGEYLQANVFVMPSTIENSPNSLAEAMLLGVPCVAADVGGTNALLKHGEEGILYPSGEPYLLARHILDVFAMEDAAGELGAKAAAHARKTHDPETNLEQLIRIYAEVSAQ